MVTAGSKYVKTTIRVEFLHQEMQVYVMSYCCGVPASRGHQNAAALQGGGV